MELVKGVLLFVTYGTYAFCLLVLAVGLLVRTGHVLRGRELWQLIQESSGSPRKGRIPRMALAPAEWLHVPAWAAQTLEADNRRAGSIFPLSGESLAVWALLRGKLWLLVSVLLASLGAGLMAMGGDHRQAFVGSGLAAAVFAFLAVRTMLEFRSGLAAAGKKRLESLQRILPYTADFLVLVLDSGGDLSGAIASYLAYGPPGPMREELKLVLQETRAGVPRVDALERFAARNPIREIERLVLVVAQGERMGTPVADTLREQAELLRMERNQRATEIAEQMAVDSRIWVAGMAMAVMLILIGPFVITLVTGFGQFTR